VQLYGHIIGIYRRSGESGGRKVVGKEGKGRRRKSVGEMKCKEAKVE